MKYLSGNKLSFVLILLIILGGCKTSANENGNAGADKTEKTMLTYVLPSPETESNVSVEKALTNRRSQRHFQSKELSMEQLSQILWAAYGVTNSRSDSPLLRGGLRTAPSAGALYPLEIYAVVGNVKGIETGVYKYVSQEHKIVKTIDKDIRAELSAATLGHAAIKDAPVTIVYGAVFSRTTDRYGERGRERYVFIEIGHSAQNIYLQAEALQLGTCAIGAFIDGKVKDVLQLPKQEEPLYLMPVGHYR